jgi:DNA (cytosine-5)-methyltransferase 1
VLTVGSLFSGIGGLDLGLERAGMEVIWQSEIDPYGCRVLKKHWPEVVNHGNIKEINWGDVVRPDVICGGYPCQPFSKAGNRKGTDDPRHLWPWVREAISVLRPKYAILENVRGHLSLGIDVVLGEMASIGYDAEWRLVSAASVGAPHLRERVIIVAYPNSSDTTHGRQCTDVPSKSIERGNDRSRSASNVGQVSMGTSRQDRALADTSSQRCLDRQPKVLTTERRLNALSLIGSGSANVADTPQQSGNGQLNYSGDSKRPETLSQSRNNGGPQRASNWQVEPDVGRVANGVPSRVDRLKGLGNAVVPQVAELIGRMVIDYDTNF